MKKRTKRYINTAVVSMLVATFLLSSTVTSYASLTDKRQSDVTIDFQETGETPINVYDAKTGKKESEIVPATGAKQVLVYAYPISFGTWTKPDGTGAATFWAQPGLIGVQATDNRAALSTGGGWSVSAKLSALKRNGATTPFSANKVKLELLNGTMLCGDVSGAVDAKIYDLIADESTVIMGPGTGTNDITLVAGGGSVAIAHSKEAANDPCAWVMRWDETKNIGGQGNIKLTILEKELITAGAYAATITWLFNNAP